MRRLPFALLALALLPACRCDRFGLEKDSFACAKAQDCGPGFLCHPIDHTCVACASGAECPVVVIAEHEFASGGSFGSPQTGGGLTQVGLLGEPTPAGAGGEVETGNSQARNQLGFDSSLGRPP